MLAEGVSTLFFVNLRMVLVVQNCCTSMLHCTYFHIGAVIMLLLLNALNNNKNQ